MTNDLWREYYMQATGGRALKCPTKHLAKYFETAAVLFGISAQEAKEQLQTTHLIAGDFQFWSELVGTPKTPELPARIGGVISRLVN